MYRKTSAIKNRALFLLTTIIILLYSTIMTQYYTIICWRYCFIVIVINIYANTNDITDG